MRDSIRGLLSCFQCLKSQLFCLGRTQALMNEDAICPNNIDFVASVLKCEFQKILPHSQATADLSSECFQAASLPDNSIKDGECRWPRLLELGLT